MTFPTNQSSSKSFSKSTGVALKSTKEEDDDSDSHDDISLADFEQQLALLTKKFRRNFRKKNKANKSSSSKQKSFPKDSSKSKPKDKRLAKSLKDNDDFEGEIQCFKCRGYGHIATECPSKKSYNKKALQAKTWDDSTSDESISSEEGEINVALYSQTSLPPSSYFCLSSTVFDSSPLVLHETSADDDESEGESDNDVFMMGLLDHNLIISQGAYIIFKEHFYFTEPRGRRRARAPWASGAGRPRGRPARAPSGSRACRRPPPGPRWPPSPRRARGRPPRPRPRPG